MVHLHTFDVAITNNVDLSSQLDRLSVASVARNYVRCIILCILFRCADLRSSKVSASTLDGKWYLMFVDVISFFTLYIFFSNYIFVGLGFVNLV